MPFELRVGYMETRTSSAEDVLLWGGVYLALANHEFHESEHEKVAEISTPAKLEQALQQGVPDPDECFERYCDCIERLPEKPRALQIYRLLDGLLQVVGADGVIERSELEAFGELATKLGVNRGGYQMIVDNYLSETRAALKL